MFSVYIHLENIETLLSIIPGFTKVLPHPGISFYGTVGLCRNSDYVYNAKFPLLALLLDDNILCPTVKGVLTIQHSYTPVLLFVAVDCGVAAGPCQPSSF